jgi:hypothetical protein
MTRARQLESAEHKLAGGRNRVGARDHLDDMRSNPRPYACRAVPVSARLCSVCDPVCVDLQTGPAGAEVEVEVIA